MDQATVPSAPPHDAPAVDAWYAGQEDSGVMVFTRGGYLSRLEIYSASNEPITVWPESRFVDR
ncbi:hypothetical protein [Streptomyces sp. NPDC021622]|uniref:hypothetical protein n=1 Tax=Streptomyces sp. NPDC021622 TaxID=3155013 RepID=UPI00340B16E4